MFDSSVIKKTGQFWKLVFGFVGILLGGGMMYYGLHLMITRPDPHPNLLFFILGGIVLGLGSFAFQCIAIRCPDCGVRWFWASVSTKDHKHFLAHVLGQTVCPSCGSKKRCRVR